MYFNGREGVKKDLITAYALINNVLKESNGHSVFFCCEFSGGRYFSQEQFTSLRDKIKAEMSSDQLLQAEEIIKKSGSQ